MSQQILAQLDRLQPESGKRLPNYIITGMTRSLTLTKYQLMHCTQEPQGSGWVYMPRGGANSLLRRAGCSNRRHLMTLSAVREENFTYMLNTKLLGGESYPILTAVLGTATGAVSAGAGLLFTVTTTASSLHQKAGASWPARVISDGRLKR
jgi:hypothetical protein